MNPIMRKLGMLAVALSTSISAFAGFYVDGIYYNIINSATKEVEVTTSNYGFYSGDIVVPSSVSIDGKQYTVTAIRKQAFCDCSGLNSITLPNSLITIGSSAFSGCSSLTSIALPNSVTTIGSSAFRDCSGLNSITLPNSLTTIEDDTFDNCSSLTSIALPNSVTTIGELAFTSCSSLTSITLPNSLTTIGDHAFQACSSLTSITLPNSVTTIEDGTFYNCSSLTSIALPNSVTTIGSSAFSGCSSLISITLPNSVTTIGDNAFQACSSLISIAIPNYVATIGKNAFIGCSSLTNIDVAGDNQAYLSNDGILYDKSMTKLICCPAGKTGDLTLPNSVTTIESYAFHLCKNLTSITFPNSLTTIGDSAFDTCSSLISITLPNSVTTIENWGFYMCESLTSITLSNSLTTIGKGAFLGCSLTSITIPNSVTTIGERVFEYNLNLTSIDVAGDNQSYSSSDGILYDKLMTKLICCPGGKTGEITIPNSVTTIGEKAFSYCYNLTSITIPNSVTTIGKKAFSYCYNLTSITSLAITPPECGADAFGNIDKYACTLYVPAESIEAYKSAPYWQDFLLVEAAESGIESVEAASAGATEVFDLSGMKVADSPDNLPAGIYIVRTGSTVRKIAVR